MNLILHVAGKGLLLPESLSKPTSQTAIQSKALVRTVHMNVQDIGNFNSAGMDIKGMPFHKLYATCSMVLYEVTVQRYLPVKPHLNTCDLISDRVRIRGPHNTSQWTCYY
jgi:hypothetical protein